MCHVRPYVRASCGGAKGSAFKPIGLLFVLAKACLFEGARASALRDPVRFLRRASCATSCSRRTTGTAAPAPGKALLGGLQWVRDEAWREIDLDGPDPRRLELWSESRR